MLNKLINFSCQLIIPVIAIGSLSFSATVMANNGWNPVIPYNPPGVVLNLKKKNIGLVRTGSYLVNAIGNCNSCHVAPTKTTPPSSSVYSSGDPFKGEVAVIDFARYLGGGRIFGAIAAKPATATTPEVIAFKGYTADNLRPDISGKPAGLTKDEFINVMRTGKDPHDATRIIQVMPWPVYQNLSTTDLKAMYEYFRALPTASPLTP
ncbi:hypothetical protein [Crenothrix polyspora]|uniref:Cytochrome c domain-containing protein n=1 Tax=Crenothrix polyspora TaxID=360316 RepID=A0A1R4HJF1_9GAMM|nr:hypothetical protein [Crenothrix polyspora]SJM96355.1 conserved exported hypothetical protein [Crenothrix polyspora]